MFRYLRLIICFTLLCGVSVSMAKELPWNPAPFVYIAKDEYIGRVLQAFAASQGISVTIPETIRNKVSGRFYFTNPLDFLTLISKAYGITWYYDGNVLYFYPLGEIETTVIRLRFLEASDIYRTLEQLGVLDTRFAWKEVANENILHISGPPRYIQSVMAIIREIENNASKDMVMEVFRLKYAWAEDLKVNMRGQSMTLPGVASLLRSVTSMQDNRTTATQQEEIDEKRTVKKKTSLTRTENKVETISENKVENVRILADPRINAVIVWDVRERMSYYARTIEKLDVSVPLIEIQVAIVDINVEESSVLGTELGFSSNVSGGTGIGGSVGGGIAPGLRAGVENGLNSLTTIYKHGMFSLMARINALATRGVANVLSRPKILTLNNQEAIIENKNTFYVRVANQDNTDLYDVSYGTTVRVTPHIVEGSESSPAIKLRIEIEDGTNSDANGKIDGLPTITTSVVSTQAIVGNSNSLIIGGHYYERSSRSKNGLPYVQNILGIGNLFGKTTTRTQKAERLFIITPTIVDIKEAAEKDFPNVIHNTMDHKGIQEEIVGPGCGTRKIGRRGILKTVSVD
ncbi:MAG: type III secretion system outer membrane ring subunit SctC [Desulfovibrionaceae bacterium]